MRRIVSWGLSALVIGSVASTAQAGGFEYTGAGTRSMGRGGATAAAPDDPMALQFNPAMLSELPGGQLMLNVNNAMFDACVSRPGNYVGDGASGMVSTYGDSNDPNSYALRNLPTVCNELSALGPGASLVYTQRITPSIGLGFGILTPMAAGHTRYGNADGSVTVNGQNLPSPVRYNLIEQNHLQIFPTVGIGWKPNSWLHVGLAFQWGIVTISNRNIAVSQSSGEPATDLYADIAVHDYFVPAIIGSIQLHPSPGLDFMIGARWLDTIRAGGTANITANRYADPMRMPPAAQVTTLISGVDLRVPEGSSITAGARYGMQRRGTAERAAARGHADRMEDEVFDLEVNATYELNSVVDEFTLNLPTGTTIDIGDGGAGAPLPTQVHLPHQWKNQLIMRLGGDWNVLPGVLALRAGMHFETSGVTPAYTQLDFIPGQRIGLHVGATYRIGRFDISAAYAHIFQETITVDGSQAAYHQIAALDAGRVINNGTYTSHYNVFSLGANVHF